MLASSYIILKNTQENASGSSNHHIGFSDFWVLVAIAIVFLANMGFKVLEKILDGIIKLWRKPSSDSKTKKMP
ncbi:MAG: hypothetical protein ACMV0K_02020 [Sulfurospirillum sp.]